MPEALYSLDEVVRRNGQFGARTWIIIKNSVYDVTEYLTQHPGGEQLISEYAGRDATIGFNDFGHSSDAKNTLKSYKIGKLIEDDKLVNRKKKKNQKNKVDIIETEDIKQRNRKILFFPLFRSCAS